MLGQYGQLPEGACAASPKGQQLLGTAPKPSRREALPDPEPFPRRKLKKLQSLKTFRDSHVFVNHFTYDFEPCAVCRGRPSQPGT